MELEELKQYLRIDSDEEDFTLLMLQLEAEEYLLGAGISKDYTKNRYKLAVMLLVSDGYENRQVRIDSKISHVSDRLGRIILQLQMEEGVKVEPGQIET